MAIHWSVLHYFELIKSTCSAGKEDVVSDLALPELVARSSFASEDDFIEACYAFFKTDFLDTRPVFRNTRMGLSTLPTVERTAETIGRNSLWW